MDDDLFTVIKESDLDLREQSDFGDLFTVRDFLGAVDCGGFIDYDGHGRLATEKKESSIEIRPSNCRKALTANPWATHIMWFNR